MVQGKVKPKGGWQSNKEPTVVELGPTFGGMSTTHMGFTLQQQAQGKHYHETKHRKINKGIRRGGILQLLLKSASHFTPIIPSIILLLLLLSRCKIHPSSFSFFL
jgi:membrane protein YqaA with SNARE-associated domain